MRRRVFLSVATVGLVGCLQRDEADRSGDQNRNTTTESSAIDAWTDAEPVDENHPFVHGDPFDDFDDLSSWSVLAGTLEQSESGVRLAARPTDERVLIGRSLSDPLDCSSVVPGLTLSAADSIVPRIQLIDDVGNRADFRRGIKSNRGPVRYSFGLVSVSGPVDLSTITELRIALWVGDRSRTMRIGELFFTPRSSPGTVMIQFDDGYATDYTEAFPLLDQYGYEATSFVNPITIGSDDRLTLDQCSQLADTGWTIGNHTHAHRRLEDLSADEQTAEIVGAREWLVDHGFEDGARYFAYPFGQWDEHTLEIVGEHHELAFWSGMGINGVPANPLLCTRVGEPTAETAIGLLDNAARWGGHVGLLYHELAGQQRADFRQTIEHLHQLESAGRLEVVTPPDLAERVRV
ncbi:putative xylanase/chitin deacetylase [Halovivax ruber XH-70]|uniref:Putative xylanase/chitin deacetylase n=1 Tax=Halovivax ruber (strain DSM 18193 / JCM 13892 / XH-70) TaxID=797302 RepID=L0IBC3_HALRX|nr:polysaccharide deacetylase family protein [Halovivax ruber]AGB15247.1 putative xylanase/chitin deacetylase [Halovivax ruber XH-70]